MDFQNFTSSTPTRPAIPKSSPSDAGGNNENDLNKYQMGYKLQNHKKPSTKHFMAPTVSAATKAAVPRKKILAERNEALNFTDTHFQKTQILDSKTSPLSSGIDQSEPSLSWVTPSYSSASEPDDDELKPYDPLTNYLSPRPKFLRYKPNRRRKTFVHGENEIKEGNFGLNVKKSVSFDSQKALVEEESSVDAGVSSVSFSQDGSVKEDDEKSDKNESTDDDDDEEEEEEEEEEEIEELEDERGWNLKGVLKFLLVLISLILSTIYMSSMNSPAPSPTLEAIWGLKDRYQTIQNNVTRKIFEGESEHMDRRGESRVGLLEMNQRGTDDIFEEEDIVEDDDWGMVEGTENLGEVVEVLNGHSADVCEHELETKWEFSAQLQDSETVKGDLESRVEASDQLLGTHVTEIEGVNDHEMEKTGKGPDELQEIETAEKSESFQYYQNPLMSDSVDQCHTVSNFSTASANERIVDLNFKDEQVECEDIIESVEGISTKEAGKEMMENEMEKGEDITNNSVEEIVMSDWNNNEKTESDTVCHETDSTEFIIEEAKIESIPIPVIGVSILFTVLASLGFVYCSRQKKTYVEDSLPMGKTLAEPAIAEKVSPVFVNVEEEKMEKVESFANHPSSLIRSTVEVSKEFSDRHAPMVELLGELVIREASSLRSCGMKSKMLESEQSNSSFPQEKKGSQQIKSGVVPIQVQPSLLEFSTANSPSYGSFTAEKKTVKKEEGKDGAVSMSATPVRRSSRIRNRAVLSP